MGAPDLPEHKRQVRTLERQGMEKKAEERRRSKEENAAAAEKAARKDVERFLADDDEDLEFERSGAEDEFVPEVELFSETDPEPAASAKVQKNYDEIPNIALASVKYGIWLRPTATIATTALIDAGIITEDDTSKVIDKNKVKRAQEKLMRELGQEFEEKCREEGGISCILFDGRIDLTNVMMEAEGRVQYFPAKIKEEHYSVASEPGSYYLFHFTPEKATKDESHAEQIAKVLFAWLKERGFDKTLWAIGGDSTNVNTGLKAGVMWKLELHMGRKLVWLESNLHTGELTLRHLIVDLDGPTLSDNKLSGPIGKLLDSATDLDINPNFSQIFVGSPLIKLPDKVIQDLSTDQHYGYNIVCAVKDGVLPARLALLEIGPVNHSRWLTTANRLLRLWVSKHGLKGKNLKNLQFIVEFIIGVYYPCWFNVKVKHSWIEGPRHILFQLDCLKSQRKEVLYLVMPTVRKSAWYAHSEAILQTLLCSKDQKERIEGVERILAIRGEGDPDTQLGDPSVRTRRTSDINCDASRIADLVSWSEGVSEPPLTCFLSTSEEKSDGEIRAQETSRRLMSTNESKQDLCNRAQVQEVRRLIFVIVSSAKSDRWYLCIFCQLIDIAVNNAWLHSRRDATALDQKQQKLNAFRLDVAKGFVYPEKQKRGHHQGSSNSQRSQGLGLI
ncbi:hypothetical protein AAFF_G00147510 [Aldrovandia affinis]|uniref:Uncharacterized protein n=1 Tax=Aldrovandia affinis TaxID=143900 RepID=A0AAD7W937_9TELE|nr:hypothetical protein AAFF_G00147510 [Aldrovandia affinis]